MNRESSQLKWSSSGIRGLEQGVQSAEFQFRHQGLGQGVQSAEVQFRHQGLEQGVQSAEVMQFRKTTK